MAYRVSIQTELRPDMTGRTLYLPRRDDALKTARDAARGTLHRAGAPVPHWWRVTVEQTSTRYGSKLLARWEVRGGAWVQTVDNGTEVSR